jgi:hypothetical protein
MDFSRCDKFLNTFYLAITLIFLESSSKEEETLIFLNYNFRAKYGKIITFKD